MYARGWGMWSYEHRAKGFTPPYGVPTADGSGTGTDSPVFTFCLTYSFALRKWRVPTPTNTNEKNKKISGYTVRGSGSCGWGTPTPSRAYVYRFCNLLKYNTLRGFSPHNNPDGEIIPRLFCLIEHPFKTVRQPTGCNREPPVFTPVRLRWCNRTADVTPSRLWWLFLWWFPLRLQA